MITAVVLIGYALVVATVGRRLLAGLTGAAAYPRLGVLAWLAAVLSVAASVLLAGLLAAGVHVTGRAFVDLCQVLARQTGGHQELAAPLVALPLVAAAGLWGAGAAVHGYAVDVRLRRRHVEALNLVGRDDRRIGATVVDAPRATAYCVDGRRPTIVVTTGALGALSGRQLAAVLAHERCHLAERHQLVVRACHLLAVGFPFVALFAEARTQVRALLEMRADDVAARRYGRRVVASALAAIAGASAPPAGLGAGGPAAVARIRRLLNTPRPTARQRWRLVAAAAGLGAGPVVALLVPFCGA
jgi:Zn-dependent protease with chaperone function